MYYFPEFVPVTTKYGLSEKDWDKIVSDIHIHEISRLFHGEWRTLYFYLELNEIVVADTERNYGLEADRKTGFLFKWKEIKGDKATYKELIHAQLRINNKLNAEIICKVLARGKTTHQFIRIFILGEDVCV